MEPRRVEARRRPYLAKSVWPPVALPSMATTTSKPRALTNCWPRGTFSRFEEPSMSSSQVAFKSWKFCFPARLWKGCQKGPRLIALFHHDREDERTLGQFATSSDRLRNALSNRSTMSKMAFEEFLSMPCKVLWKWSKICWWPYASIVKLMGDG